MKSEKIKPRSQIKKQQKHQEWDGTPNLPTQDRERLGHPCTMPSPYMLSFLKH